MQANNIDFNGQIDIHQRRLLFEDPKDVTTHALTNVIIYCSQYYPCTRELLVQMVKIVGERTVGNLLDAVAHLYGCLEREVVAGPSSSYVPPSEIPNLKKVDDSMQLYGDLQRGGEVEAEKEKNLIKVFEQLKLDSLFSKKRVKELFWYNCSLLSMKSVQNNNINYAYYSSELEFDGESWLQSTPFSALFVTLAYLLSIIAKEVKLQPVHLIRLKLMRARLGQLHNKCLKHPVGTLAELVLSNYKQAIGLSKHITLEDYIELLLQYSYSLLFYYKYSQSETVMRHCANLLHMKIQFTGKLGRRTKYQLFDTPQLVMNLVERENGEKQEDNKIHDCEEEEGEKMDMIDAKELVKRQLGLTEITNKSNIMASTFDQQSILLQSPKFVEQGESTDKPLKGVSQTHLLVALSILYFQWRSTSRDQMLLQNISASIVTLLKYEVQTSFSYRFALLLLRSLNEFSRIKNTERALDQLEKLKTGFNSRCGKDISNLYATPYETYLGFILILADKYMELGLSITAVELFQEAGLYEECIDGLIGKSFKEKALQMANKLIDQKGKNPRILCMLGDINGSKQPSFYEQAWELSKGTCARAQRSLGWLYFNQGAYQKAAESFSKATQASYYHPNTWFSLGCCYMRVNQFEKALKAFSECVSIDDSQGEAWGNMASCYMYQKKMKQAYSTLNQAVKFSESNWKLWANLLSVALSIKQFYKYFECLQRLVRLGRQQVLTEEILAKVVQIMVYHNEQGERKRTTYNCKNRIDRLFTYLQQSIGENPLVWRTKTNYLIELLEYFNVLGVHYSSLHQGKGLDPNDMVPGYETLESTALITRGGVKQTKREVVEAKQNELNMVMRVGWNENKLQSERVRKTLEEYVQIYRKYSDQADKEQFRLFVSGVAQKVSAGLQSVYSVPLQWL